METVKGHHLNKKNKPQGKVRGAVPAAHVAGASATVKQDAQHDYLKLMLSQERRLESLEQENAELTEQRDNLQKRCDAQLEVIEALKVVRKVVQIPPEATKAHERAIQLNDLPEFHESEFQPINDVPQLTGVQQASHMLISSVKFTVGLIKSLAGWMAKRVLAILT